MWWDWTGITLFDSVLFSLLSLLVLYLVGFGILRLICALGKRIDPFSSFDLLQKSNFRIIFGFIFIFLFLLIFSIFNLSFLTSTLLIVAIAVIGFATTCRSFKLKLPKKPHFQNYAFIMVIIVFVILLATIFLSSMPRWDLFLSIAFRPDITMVLIPGVYVGPMRNNLRDDL